MDFFSEQHECHIDILKKWYAECRVVSGTATFQEVFRLEGNDRVSYTCDEDQGGCSTGWKHLHCWRQTLPLCRSVVLQRRCPRSKIVDGKTSIEESE